MIQLHINDAKGTDSLGEGVFPTEGEIPIKEILQNIKYGTNDESNDNTERTRIQDKALYSRNRDAIQATIELKDGHLRNGEIQRKATEWLITSIGDVFY